MAFFSIFSLFFTFFAAPHQLVRWNIEGKLVFWAMAGVQLVRDWEKGVAFGKHVRTDGPGRGARLETFRIQTPDK